MRPPHRRSAREQDARASRAGYCILAAQARAPFSEWVLRGVVAFAVLLGVAASPASAQEEHVVSGRVVDAETSETLPGVSIVIKGT
ncbi:MAG: hypothetical protein ACREM1_22035, partial [Longimicrobiales bacterium]